MPSGRRYQPPQMLPQEAMRLHFDPDELATISEGSAFGLVQESVRLLHYLEQPTQVDTSFNLKAYDNIVKNDVNLKNLRLSAQRSDKQEYTFSTRLLTGSGEIDEIDYVIRKPEMTGFVVPWAISFKGISRIILPRYRRKIGETDNRISSTAPVNAVKKAIQQIRRQEYSLTPSIIRDGAPWVHREF